VVKSYWYYVMFECSSCTLTVVHVNLVEQVEWSMQRVALGRSASEAIEVIKLFST
jgi:hypothetical protein